MNAREYIMNHDISKEEDKAFRKLCRNWYDFSTEISDMNKTKVAKLLKYLVLNKPHNKTLGNRAVGRFNMLNKVEWRHLTNGQ